MSVRTIYFARILVVFLFCGLTITGCAPSPKDNNKAIAEAPAMPVTVPDSVVDFLLFSAASDFKIQKLEKPIDIRDVRIGYLTSPTKEKIYLMCGSFLSPTYKEWTAFTTIKTSGYEQYTGETTYCKEATFVADDKSLADKLKILLSED